MDVLARALVLDEILRVLKLADVVVVRAGLYVEAVHVQLVRRGFGERADHEHVVVGAGRFHLETLDERLRRVAQLKQAQRRDYVEDVLPQREQRDDDRRPDGAEEHRAEGYVAVEVQVEPPVNADRYDAERYS